MAWARNSDVWMGYFLMQFSKTQKLEDNRDKNKFGIKEDFNFLQAYPSVDYSVDGVLFMARYKVYSIVAKNANDSLHIISSLRNAKVISEEFIPILLYICALMFRFYYIKPGHSNAADYIYNYTTK